MKQEDRELLFKDLCGRLPYGVKCLVNYTICNETTDYEDVKSSTVDTLVTINQQTESYFFEWLCEWFDFDEFKPYLFPLSSMTEKQKKEFSLITCDLNDSDYWRDGNMIYVDDKYQLNDIIDFYHKNHLDYRGLIEKEMANDATGKNIY